MYFYEFMLFLSLETYSTLAKEISVYGVNLQGKNPQWLVTRVKP